MKRYSICAQDTNKTAEWTVILSVREILTKEASNPSVHKMLMKQSHEKET